ncbi:Ku protein [Kytococcus sedentarius]|uniref:non-homologous end joining protein Ku n=1 Tax=Kytococcus sedentarius TaxID=1276 RepID=UPI00194EDB11|nr:Ku protein [Kytococcus sedentarius]QRO86813.1 Ku protein [Kytococcus sedentarius]
MRAVWSGAISFGLVNVPVKAYSAVEDHDISFHQVHDADGGRIRYQRTCEVCGKKVDYQNIDKAYSEGDDTIILSAEELKELPAAEDKEIEVLQFVPADQVDPIMFERSYFLEPEEKSPKSYLLLRQTLQDTDRVAIVQFSLRNKTRLGALRVRDKVLLLQGMLWADEVREVEFAGTKSRAKIGEKELKLSAALVEQYASDFTPEEFEDEYQVELRELIDAKLEAGDTLDTDATEGKAAPDGAAQADDDSDDAEVIDLMEALKSSLDRRAGGSGSGSGSGKKSTSSAKKSGSSSKSGTGSSGGSGSKKTTSKKTSTSSKKNSGSASKSA